MIPGIWLDNPSNHLLAESLDTHTTHARHAALEAYAREGMLGYLSRRECNVVWGWRLPSQPVGSVVILTAFFALATSRPEMDCR